VQQQLHTMHQISGWYMIGFRVKLVCYLMFLICYTKKI